MAGEWQESSLGDLITVKHGFAFRGEFIHDEPRGDILLTPGNFAIGGGFKGDKFKYFDGPVPDDFVLAEGDLLVTMTDLSKQSDTLGFPAFVPSRSDGRRYLHNQRLGKVLVKDKRTIDTRYLHYLLCSDGYRHEVLASATGTTVKHTSPERIQRYRFMRPPLGEQRAIAHILGTLDAKIELNRRISETLEAMARALFKSWFVDFDPVRAKAEGRLPAGRQATPAPRRGVWFVYAIECENGSYYVGHTEDLERRYDEHASGKGADWTKRHPPRRLAYWEEQPSQAAAIAREKKLKTGSGREWLKSEIAKRDFLSPGLPKPLADLFPARLVDSELGEIPEGWEVGTLGDVAEHLRRGVRPEQIEPGTPYIALEHMPKRCIALSDWGHGEGLESNKFRFNRGEILFGKLRPYFHKVGVAPVDGVCSTDIVVIAPRAPEWFGYVLGHTSSAEFVDFTDAGSTGTKMPRTNWKDMARYELVLPPQSVAMAFTRLIRPAIDRLVAGIHESRTLAALRDTLLPKLMSGELRLGDAMARCQEDRATMEAQS